ncbi:hypothetical protein C5N14_01775 [Micromonospora sp. MW-13]|uniref:DUF7507 domain-containing protein n=1 Tax=Micromonospora sp. MW-13 TaxID=2094022 RepID=UPI000E43C010|nr:LPXTG cell wall anchor domain-containing protein [Micromonospora sp. MW-13]RGC70850.1 hypothetical protein C5N14_01775 [Micromonospora sp. MW-13]
MSKTSSPSRRAGIRVRLAAFTLLAGALLLAAGSPAVAASTININPGNVPTTAAEFTQDCDPNLGGGPFPNEDVWVFNLPGDSQTSGIFESITATFSTPSGTVTRTIPTDPNSAIVNGMGTSKAWIRLPAGWTLTGATAVISGSADFFVLSQTCAASNPQVNPKLGLTKTGTPATGVQAGDKVTYTYTVTNQSTGTTDPITGITVTDDTVSGITCQATSLAPGASTTCTGTYTVTKADVDNGKIVNTAQATGTFHEQKVSSNQATFTVTTEPTPPKQASLSIDKKARVESDCHKKCENDGFAAKGDKIFYTYRVTNTGTVTITNVAVDDPTAGAVVCNSTTLAPGTSTDCHAVKPHVVTSADVKAGKVVNTARATGKFDGKTVTSDPATVTVCIRDGKFDHRHDGKDDEHGKHDKGDKDEPKLPVTGDSSAGALSLAGGLLASGGLLLGASRIRRRAHVQV